MFLRANRKLENGLVLTKAGKDGDFKLKTEQKSIIEAVVDIFTPFARTVTFVKNFLQIFVRSTKGPRCIFAIGGGGGAK